MAIMRYLEIFGQLDSTLRIDPAALTGDYNVDRAASGVTRFKQGTLVKISSTGYADLTSASGDVVEGVVINDAAGYGFENAPALASGILTILCGGGLIETDNFVAGQTPNAGVLVYSDANGQFTTAATASQSVGITRSVRTADSDLTRVRLFGK